MSQKDTGAERLKASVREYFERTWDDGDLSVIEEQLLCRGQREPQPQQGNGHI